MEYFATILFRNEAKKPRRAAWPGTPSTGYHSPTLVFRIIRKPM